MLRKLSLAAIAAVSFVSFAGIGVDDALAQRAGRGHGGGQTTSGSGGGALCVRGGGASCVACGTAAHQWSREQVYSYCGVPLPRK